MKLPQQVRSQMEFENEGKHACPLSHPFLADGVVSRIELHAGVASGLEFDAPKNALNLISVNHQKRSSRISDSLNTVIALMCFGLLAGISCLCAEPPGPEKTVHLKVSAIIDGSDRLTVTHEEARWDHLTWDLATNVIINGMKWPLEQSLELKNAGKTQLLPPNVDLSTARVVDRHGRDVAGMEIQPGKIIIYFDDNPNGSAPYDIDVAFDTIRASQTGNAPHAATPTVSQASSVATPVTFSQWETSNSITGTSSATPQNDGTQNLLKYLFNINPTRPMNAADRAALPMVGLTANGGIQYLTLTYRKYASETGLTVAVQTSPDLKSWQTVIPNITQEIGVDPTTGDPIMEVEVNVTSSTTKFIRLNITGTISGQSVSAVTTPEGYLTYDFPATSGENSTSYFSLPLTGDPIYANIVASVTANSITVADNPAPWTAGALVTATPYFVKFLSGAETGRIIRVTANSTNALTLDTTDNSAQAVDLTTSGFSVQAGDTFEIIPGDTLASAFGADSADLIFTGGPSYGASDLVEIYNPASAAWQNYYFNTTSGFWTINGTTTNANTTILYPYSAIKIVRRPNESEASFELTGRVAEVGNRIKTTGGGPIYASTGYATGMTLAQLNFGTNWTENTHTITADNLSIWNASLARFDIYFQMPDGTWRTSAEATTDQSNVVIPAESVISILKRGIVSGPTSFLQPALPYTP